MRALLVLLMMFYAVPALAQTLRVRSGEHADFSRLVVPLPQATIFSLTSISDTLRLETTQNQFTYDISEIFQRIPKTRLLAASSVNGTLVLTMATGVVPVSQQLTNGTVVIDLRSGPTDPNPSVGKIGFPRYSELFWQGQIPLPKELPIPEVTQRNLDAARVSAAEQVLWTNMTRAAAQGIISVDPLKKHMLKSDVPVQGFINPENTDIIFPFQMETVVDRDTKSVPSDLDIKNMMNACPDDALFAVETWQDDSPFIDQLAPAQNALVGEFDRPNRTAILTLARLYLSYGFGREAQATLAAFDVDGPEAQAISDMAAVIDGPPQPLPLTYAGYNACDGKIALWSFLGVPLPTGSSPPPAFINIPAVQKAFSAAPPPLRAILGPDLVAKLISIGRTDAAEVILNAMQRRAAFDGGTAFALAKAQFLLTSDHPAAAEDVLATVPKTNDIRALQSLILSVEAKLAQQKPIDNDTIMDMTAQLTQADHTEAGLPLRRALARAQASVGRFSEAFAVLHDGQNNISPDAFSKTWIEIGWMLARVPNDTIFISQVFDKMTDFQTRSLPQPLTLAIADRLASLGFRHSAEQIIPERQRTTIDGRLSLARAALADRDGAAALAHLQGLDGETVLRLRAQSYKLLGEHQNAANIFQNLNDPTATAQEAWRGAAHDLVLEYGSDLQRAAYTTPPPTDTAGTGPLGQATELIRQSQKDREMLDSLLAPP